MNHISTRALLCFFFITAWTSLIMGQQYFDAKIIMNNGTEKTGFIQAEKAPNIIKVDVFNKDAEKVMFSTNADGPYKAIPSRSIKELEISKGPEHIMSLKYLDYKIQMGKGPLKAKEYKKPYWFVIINQCKNIEVYEAFAQIGIKGDNLIRNPDLSYYGASHEPAILIKKTKEKRASIVGRYLDTTEPDKAGPKTFQKMNRKLFGYYFQNDQKVLKMIGDKNISPNSIQNILEKICVE